MSLRNSLLAAGLMASLNSLARAASLVDTCTSGLAGTLVPIISTCTPAQSFCSAHYPQSSVTATITGSNTVTETVSTLINTHSITTVVTVTAIDVTSTAPTVTATSSTVTVSLIALTMSTTTTSTETDTSTSYTATATCPNYNGAGDKRWAPTTLPPPNCRPLSQAVTTTTTTTATTTQDPCSSAISVLSSITPLDASTVCGCFATPITETQTVTPTVTTTASADTTMTMTMTTTVTPTATVSPTVTLHPTITVTPAPSTYTSTVTTTTTTTVDALQHSEGQLTGSSSCGCIYLTDCGGQPVGIQSYYSYTGSSVQDCANMCSNSNGRCNGASFQISNRQCSLYSQEINGTDDNTDFVAIVLYYCNNGSCYE